MQQINLDLPVPAYLRKILIFKYGEEYIASETSLLGITILHALNKKSARFYDYKRKKTFSCLYRVKIGLEKAKRVGYKLDAQKAYQIAKALQKHFREELYMLALINKEIYEIDYQTTLMDWLEIYEIEDEELSYRTLRKGFDRYLYKMRASGELKRKNIV